MVGNLTLLGSGAVDRVPVRSAVIPKPVLTIGGAGQAEAVSAKPAA